MLADVTKWVTFAIAAAATPALLVSSTGTAHANPGDGNPGVSFTQALTNLGPQLVVDITSNADSGANCTYTADSWFQRSFYLNARKGYRLVIVPSVPKFGNWDIVVRCDNGTDTRTTYFY